MPGQNLTKNKATSVELLNYNVNDIIVENAIKTLTKAKLLKIRRALKLVDSGLSIIISPPNSKFSQQIDSDPSIVRSVSHFTYKFQPDKSSITHVIELRTIMCFPSNLQILGEFLDYILKSPQGQVQIPRDNELQTIETNVSLGVLNNQTIRSNELLKRVFRTSTGAPGWGYSTYRVNAVTILSHLSDNTLIVRKHTIQTLREVSDYIKLSNSTEKENIEFLKQFIKQVNR